MAKISLLVPDADLAFIDEVAAPNRTAFMLAASREAALRVHRERDDAEIARILDENVPEDRALLDEFAGTVADGQ